MRKDPAGNPLPPRLHWKHGRYWYVHQNKWNPLPATYVDAMARYARLRSPGRGVGTLVDTVMLSLEKRGKLAENTLKQYRLAAEKIKAAMVEFDPSEVKQTDVAQFHYHLSATHPNMANRVLTVMRIVFDHAVKSGLCEFNPAIGVKRVEEAQRDRYLTDAEFIAIRAQAPAWLQSLMDVAYLTAQRIGDLLSLQWPQVSEAGIEFRQQKSKSRLLVEMTPELQAALAEARKAHGNVLSPYVWHPRGKGTAYSYWSARDAYRRSCARAGVKDTTLHDLRAKSLTDANQEGSDATKLAGHSSPAMTKRYLRLKQTVVVSGPKNIRRSMDR
jgi:integrase